MAPNNEGGNSAVLKHLLAGGVAGAVSRTVVSPLERMKILFQVQGPGDAKYNGIIPTLAKIYREEGIIGYFKGNGTNVIRIAPYSAVQFASYEQYKSWLLAWGNQKELGTIQTLLAGAGAGITSATSTYPLDMIRTRLSVQGLTDKRYKGIFHAFGVIYRDEGGIFGLYRGMVPTILGVAPYVAVNFTVYETLRGWFANRKGESGPSTLEKLFCGAASGTTAQTLTYPFDVIRRRMQVDSMPGSKYHYKGTFNAFVVIISQEGYYGLFKGMIPNYLKVAPAVATSFVTYEWVKVALKT